MNKSKMTFHYKNDISYILLILSIKLKHLLIKLDCNNSELEFQIYIITP